MKKVAVFVLFMALASSAFAGDDFVTRESERSGVAGTFSAIGNSIGGFFNSIGESMQKAKAGMDVHRESKGA